MLVLGCALSIHKSFKIRKKRTCAVWGARYTIHARYIYIKRNVEKVWGARYTSVCVIYRKTRAFYDQVFNNNDKCPIQTEHSDQ
jgi:hypothetical protein